MNNKKTGIANDGQSRFDWCLPVIHSSLGGYIYSLFSRSLSSYVCKVFEFRLLT